MGVTNIVTVKAAAKTYDLTDLPTVRDELSIKPTDTGNDKFLQRAISQTSKVIANYCNRVFPVETISETIYVTSEIYPYQVPGGVQPLQLSRYPIYSVASVTQFTSSTGTMPMVAGTDYKIDSDSGQLIRLNAFSGAAVMWEAWPVTVEYTAGYFSEAVEAAQVPDTPGPYVITVKNAANLAIDKGVTKQDGTPLVMVTTAPLAGEYNVDLATGIYTFNAIERLLNVNIAGVYTDIPDDLVEAALRLITGRFRMRGRDPTLTYRSQPALGDERYWVGGMPGQKGGLPPEIAGMLDGTYRVPVTS